MPMRRSRIIPATILFLILSACGGGSGGSSGESGAISPLPPAPTPPTPTPPPTPVPAPVISAVSPAQADIGVVTIFTVTGSDLVDGMTFSLTDCAQIVELARGDSVQRRFSCTPTGQAGTRQGAVHASASAAAPLFALSVDYRAVVAFVANVGWRYAAIKSDGSLWSWNPQQPTPVKVGDDYADVAVSLSATLAIKKDGSLWSWGSNDSGILGNGTQSWSTVPTRIGTDFVKVVVKGENTTGGESAEALKKDGSLWVWGARSQMQPNAAEPELAPRMVASGFVDIARGSGGASLGLKGDGSLWTWNRNLSDQPFVPVKVADGYVAIATGYDVAYGLKADRTLWNWGRMAPHQAGTSPTVTMPAKVGDGFVGLSTGIHYALAVKADGTLWAGGDGASGQFGEGQASGGLFRQVNTGVVDAWAGSSCSFVKKSDGSVWAAGLCDLGDGKFSRYIYVPELLAL